MNINHIVRLKEEQEIAIGDTCKQIDQWEKYKCDYSALKERLKTLPDTLTRDVMVPFGPKAFIPGQFVHTNEIMVLLGDNWFVERSAKQAGEIVDRRLKAVEEQLEKLHKQKKLLEPRLDFTSDLQDIAEHRGDVVDITEEYDPEKDKLWREQHKKNVKAYRKTVCEKAKGRNESKTLTDEELWERLDVLERLEKERKEIERLSDDDVLQGTNNKLPAHAETTSTNRRVQWEDKTSSSTGDSGDETDDEKSNDTENSANDKPKKIYFQHTKGFAPLLLQADEESTKETEKQINSPRDVYQYYGQILEPKSILKPSNSQSTEIRSKSILKPSNSQSTETRSTVTETNVSDIQKIHTPVMSAVSEVVKERASGQMSEPVAAMPPETDKPKRISKFKARRQQQQHEAPR